MNKTSNLITLIGIVLILIVGLIHVIDAKDSFSDAIYKGWLFYANGVAAVVASYGIYHKKNWGWNAGFLIAIGSMGGYVASRTVGLPYVPAEPENWFEPLGVVAMSAEALFIVAIVVKKVRKL